MLKLFVAAALLGSVSTLVAMPATDAVVRSPSTQKADRLEARNNTQVRNYVSPQQNGKPVAFCLTGEDSCGKDAADAFCRGNGFGEAITFQRDNGALSSAQVVFRQIKCRHSAAVETREGVLIEPAGASILGNAAGKSDSF